MTELSSLEAVRTLSPIFNECGGKFMLHPDTMAAAAPAGYANGFLLYAAGRGGVLGDVHPDVIVAAFGFFQPDLVHGLWGPAIEVEGAAASVARYTEIAAEWGRSRLTGVEGVERFATLLARVLDAARVDGLSLFAGWRAVPRPVDAPARAYLLMHVAREWRGSAHVIATRVTGLRPLESVLTNQPGVTAGAKLFGWPEPYPDVSGLLELRAEAEQRTDDLLVEAYETLTGTERGELADLADQLRTAILAAG